MRHHGGVLGPRRRGAPVRVVRAGAHRGAAARAARARHARHHATAGLLTAGGPAAHTAVSTHRVYIDRSIIEKRIINFFFYLISCLRFFFLVRLL